MKNSYKIITALAVILVIGIGSLLICQFKFVGSNINETQISDESANEENNNDKKIIPFAHIAAFQDELYTTDTISKTADIIDAKSLPVNSEQIAVTDGTVYYITVGDDKFAPELRCCDTNGENDKSITEFTSSLGSPAIVGDYIYSAYYGREIEDENAGIFKINLTSSDYEAAPMPVYEKIADGEYYIYGYDNEYIYYATNDGSTGTVLYRMTLNGENGTEVLNYKLRSECIVIDNRYIFFSAYDDISHSYKIYRSPKDGHGNIDEYSFECMSGRFDIIEDRLYYQADNSIYSSDLNGNNERKVISLEENSAYAYEFLKFDNILYFREKSDTSANITNTEKDPLFRLDTETVEKKNISK